MPFKKVGALWLREGKKGLSGQVSEDIAAGSKVFVFPNTFKKKGERTPDYTLNIPVDDGESGAPAQKQDAQPAIDDDNPF